MSFELLSLAIKQNSLRGLSEMLRVIAQETESYACILWRTAPQESGLGKHLFAVAEWCEDGRRCASRNLSSETSFTGRAIQAREQRIARDIPREIEDRDIFLTEGKISTLCSTPIQFLDEVWGAVNLYRQGQRPYSDATAAIALQRAILLPALFQMIEDEVSFSLYRTVDQIIRDIAVAPTEEVPPIRAAGPLMKAIAEVLAMAFNCEEVSVFLEDRVEAEGIFDLAHTTWQEKPFRASYKREQGITGWAAAHPDTKVIVFDLEDDATIRAQYPGMQPLDSLRVRKAARANPRLSHLQQLSLMAAPMQAGGRVVGVIRCAFGRGPLYFDARQHLVLERVASQIGWFWRGLLDRLEIDEERRSLGALVTSISHLNSFAHADIMKELRDIDMVEPTATPSARILDEALRITHTVIRGAEITDVRLKEGRKLKFKAIHGRAWHVGTRRQIEARMNREYDLDEDPPRSAGVKAMRSGELYEVMDPKKDPFYFENFPDTKHMLVVPLKLGSPSGDADERYGVLDVRSVTDRAFSDSAKHVAGLLSSQLALYQKLSMVVKGLRDKVEQLDRMKAQQVQINEDLAHQLKHPTMTTYMRLDALVRTTPEGDLRNKLRAARGVSARAMHVAANARLFATLAAGKKIRTDLKTVTGEEILRLLVNSAQDAAYFARGEQKGAFHVVPDGFKAITEFTFDIVLLEQAVTQLLDNAFKYSYPDTQVVVEGGYTRAQPPRVKISVIDEGIPLHTSEVTKCVDRGWQSEEAKDVSDTGSGIGLWIVGHIMEAHHGLLSPIPTNEEGKTEFSLIFPVRQP